MKRNTFQTTVVILFIISFSTIARSQARDPILSIGESGFPDGNGFNYGFSITPTHSDEAPIMTQHQEDGQFIISKSSSDTWALRERVSRFHLSDPVTISPSGLKIPQTLWATELGMTYGHRRKNGQSLGVNFSIGSASDKIFHSRHETVLQLAGNYRRPIDMNHAWLFFLAYSNNRHFFNNLPLPGFAYYFYSPLYRVRAILGFPFISFVLTPTPQWEGRFSIFGPRRLSTEVAFRIKGPFQTYGRYEWGQQEWLRADRENNKDRLFFDRQRVMLGLRTPVSKNISIDTSIGREFKRRLFEHDSANPHGIPMAELPNSSFLDAKFSYRY